MKFEVFAGSTELANVAVLKGFAATQVSCSTEAGDAREEVAAHGGIVLNARRLSARWDDLKGRARVGVPLT
jgi:hypothetical protein